MKTILIGLTIISILALTSMVYAGDYYRGKGYSVYAGFYGPPVFNVVIGNGHARGGYYLNGYGSYYYGYGKPYYGQHKRYKYMRPYSYGYRDGRKFYGRGYKRFPRRGYWR